MPEQDNEIFPSDFVYGFYVVEFYDEKEKGYGAADIALLLARNKGSEVDESGHGGANAGGDFCTRVFDSIDTGRHHQRS